MTYFYFPLNVNNNYVNRAFIVMNITDFVTLYIGLHKYSFIVTIKVPAHIYMYTSFSIIIWYTKNIFSHDNSIKTFSEWRVILASYIWDSTKMIRPIFCIKIGIVIYYNFNYLEYGVIITSLWSGRLHVWRVTTPFSPIAQKTVNCIHVLSPLYSLMRLMRFL